MLRRVVSSPGGWVVSRVLAQALEFGGWVLLARRLGTGGVGVLAVASIVARMLGLVGDWGAAFRGPRDVVMAGRDSDLVRALVWRRQVVSSALATAMALAAVVGGEPAVLPIVLTVVARGGGRDWIALGESRRVAAALPLLIQGAVIVAAASFASSIAAGALAIGAGQLAGLALSVRLNPVRSGRTLRRVAVDSWYLVAGLADQVLVSSDTVLIVIIQTSVEAGVYNSVYRFPLAWLTIVGLCTAAAVPMVADAVASRRLAPGVAHRRADLIALLGALVTIPVGAVSLLLVVPVFGADFGSGRGALLVLFVAAGVTTASAPYRVLYTAFASDRRVAIATSGAAGLNVLANLAVIGRWGIEGAATTTLLSQIAMFAFFAAWSRRARHPRRVVPSLAISG